MKILIIGGIAHSLVNFRGPLIQDMLAKGHEVWTCAGEPRKDVMEMLHSWGAQFVQINLSRTGMRPWEELRSFLGLKRLINELNPDMILAYTIKPVIWGGLAARLSSESTVFSMIEGLGYAFMPQKSIRHWVSANIAKLLYRLSLRNSTGVFFLNPDDLNHFLKEKYVKSDRAFLLNGIGIDLNSYEFKKVNDDADPCKFLMISRLIADKGVREYVQAARKLQSFIGSVCCRIAGDLDSNPASVSQLELKQWQDDGVIDYLGWLDDVRSAYEDCSVYVLPSYYREGLPRTILEAMASGKPIITTDTPGCRETVPLTVTGREQKARGESVLEGENGFLVRIRDVQALVNAMALFIQSPELIQRMGIRSREIAKEKYDVNNVNSVILQTMGMK